MNTGSPVTAEMVGRTCPYCRFDLEQGVSVVACPVCAAVHHGDCWQENGGCAVALCAGGPSLGEASQQGQPAEPEPEPAQPAAPLPPVTPPDPATAPTMKVELPPPPPGNPPPRRPPSLARWAPLLAVAIVLLGGATAAAIVLTKHEHSSSETVTAAASEAPAESGEYEEEPGEELEYEEEPGYEEEEFEEEEEEEASSAQVAQDEVQQALRAHFHRLANGNYSTAFYDLTASEQESAGGESSWVEAQAEDDLQSFNLGVETSLFDAHSAEATIVDFRTHALATGCNDWWGHWEMKKVYGEWQISEAKLEKEPC